MLINHSIVQVKERTSQLRGEVVSRAKGNIQASYELYGSVDEIKEKVRRIRSVEAVLRSRDVARLGQATHGRSLIGRGPHYD